MKPIQDWLTAHPIGFAIALFVLSAIISVYSSEIKSFLRTWPGRTARTGLIYYNRNRLNLLTSAHNNAYNLMIFLASEVFGFVQVVFIWGLLYAAFVFLVDRQMPRNPFGAIALGIAYGRAAHVMQILKQLCNYEKVTAEIRKVIEETEAKQQKKAAGQTVEHREE